MNNAMKIPGLKGVESVRLKRKSTFSMADSRIKGDVNRITPTFDLEPILEPILEPEHSQGYVKISKTPMITRYLIKTASHLKSEHHKKRKRAPNLVMS